VGILVHEGQLYYFDTIDEAIERYEAINAIDAKPAAKPAQKKAGQKQQRPGAKKRGGGMQGGAKRGGDAHKKMAQKVGGKGAATKGGATARGGAKEELQKLPAPMGEVKKEGRPPQAGELA